MGRKSSKEKNPLSQFTRRQREEAVNNYYRSIYLMNGIRLAAATGLRAGIFDQIVKVSKDKKTGTITRKSIENFLDEFTECCFPSYREIPTGSFTAVCEDGEEREFETDEFDSDEARIFDHGMNTSDGLYLEFKDFVRCFTGVFILYSVLENTFELNSVDKLLGKTDHTPPGKCVIAFDRDQVIFDMNGKSVKKMKDDLKFDALISKFEEYHGRLRYEGTNIFFMDLEENMPFYDIHELYKTFEEKPYPTLPTLIREVLLEGIEGYCFNNGMSVLLTEEEGRTVPNEEYAGIIGELRDVISSVLMIRNEEG